MEKPAPNNLPSSDPLCMLPLFHVVFAFNGVAADYDIVGIFSKPEDAQTCHLGIATRNKASGIVRWQMDEIADHIAQRRLGVLAAILFPKEKEALRFASTPRVDLEGRAGHA